MARLAPYALLLLEVLLFFRKVLFTKQWFLPWDFRGYHLPLASFASESFRQGHLPLWDPWTYAGFPQFANLQAQTFYPPAIVTHALGAVLGEQWVLPLLTWQMALHVWLAGIFTMLLMRRIGAGLAAQLMAATVFQLGGFFASQAQHLGAVCGVAWMPLAWWASTGEARRRDELVLAVALGMTLLAGFPAIAIVTLGSSVLLALVNRRWRLAVVGPIWGIALAAVQLVPTLELLRNTAALERAKSFGAGGGMPWIAFRSLIEPGHNHIFELDQFKLPYQPTFLYLYCGLASLPLIILAVLGRRAWLWVLAALLMGTAMLGEQTAVWRGLYPLLPEAVRSAIYPEYFLAAFLLAMAVLAGLGLPKQRWTWALVAITAADLTWHGSGKIFNAMAKDGEAFVTGRQFEGSADTLAGMRQLVNRAVPPMRIDVYEDSMNWASSAQVLKVPTASGNDPLVLARYQAVRSLYGEPANGLVKYLQARKTGSPVLDFLNVGYLVSWGPDDKPVITDPKWTLQAKLPGHHVYGSGTALPRFFFVEEATTEKWENVLGKADWNPRKLAAVEGIAGRYDARGSVVVKRYEAQWVEIETTAGAESLLVSSEVNYPGWTATIDGKQAPLLLVNGAFRGLVVPAGVHHVAMHFAPASLWIGLGFSLAALLVLAANLRLLRFNKQ